MPELSEIKDRQRAVWAAGGYDVIARGVRSVADHVVRVAKIRPCERVLDVACGTGNTTLAARARGAEATGLDLTPELVAIARRRAEDDGYEDIDWRVGDAENLPFVDAVFDVVTSTCGLMFAPDRKKAAAEAARVTRIGGRIAIQAWTKDGGVGRMFELTNAYVPVAPGAASPFDWGDEAVVRELLSPAFRDFRFERYDCPEFAATPEAAAALYIDFYGPMHRVYRSLAPESAQVFRRDLIEFFRGYVTPADKKVRFGREYLITLATRV